MPHGDSTRDSTAALSRFLAGPDGTLALARMQVLGTASTRSTDIDVPVPRDGRVGVWLRRVDRLRRDPGLREQWRYWADRDEIRLAGDRLRIAVVGESAARGYFFDPAHSLATLVRDALGGARAECLDLARTNCSLPELLLTVAEACELGADALIVHAGNNWNNVVPQPVELRELATLIRHDGVPAGMAAFRTLVADVSAAALDVVRKLAGDRPVVLVVPEFNLADWSEEPILSCPALPAGRLARWRELRERAEAGLDAGQLTDAAELADQMVALDGEASPVSLHLRARASTDPAARLGALEAARDSVVSPFTLHSPRTLAAVQRVMRERGSALGFHVVDQPALFRAAGGVPGRRFFLDYCHLTFEGLHRTATAAATALAPQFGCPPPPATAVTDEPSSRGLAHFLAAVHNAHYGQPESILRHHVRLALDSDPAVAEHLAAFLDYQTRRAPNWMCASYERSARVPAVRRYLVVGDGRLNGKLADHTLREVLVGELERHGRRGAREGYEELLIAEHAGGGDLLDDAALAETFGERAAGRVGPLPGYLRAFGDRTRSTVVLARPEPLAVEVTWRLPAAQAGPAPVRLVVNGRDAGTATVDGAWRTDVFRIHPELLRRGRNAIEIHWPADGDGADALLDSLPDRLECGEVLPAHPVHGHVHAWTAVPA